MDVSDLKNLSNKRYDPWFFSIKMVGVRGTLIGFYKEFIGLVREGAYRRTMKNHLLVLLLRLIG